MSARVSSRSGRWLRGLWLHPDFLKFWFGQTVSQFGSRISREAINLTAVFLLAATPSQLGILTALASLPALVGLFAGVWVDRLRRRPILIVTDLGRCVVLLSIPVAALAGNLSMPLLAVVLVVTGLLGLFFDTAYQSMLPSLVSVEAVLEGNSKLATTESLAEIGGPTIAGVLIQLISAPLAIFFDALSFLVSAISVALIRQPEPRPTTPETQPNIRAEIAEGWRVIVHNPVLRTLALARGVRSFFGSFYGVLYSVYAIRELGMSPALIGVLISAGGVGALVGSAVAGWLPRRFGLGRVLTWTLLIGSPIAFLTPLATGPLLVAALMLFIPQLLGDGLAVIFEINELSLRQIQVPDRLLGRANATSNFLAQAVMPLGALVGGALGDLIGMRQTLLIAVIGWLVTAVWVARSPVRRA